MADESNVAWKRNFTKSNLVILVYIDSRLRLPSQLFGGRDFCELSNATKKKGTESPLLRFKIGMQMMLSRRNI